MNARSCGLVLMLLLGLTGGGCAASPAAHPGQISRSLVMMPGAGGWGAAVTEGPAWRRASEAWEYGRHDARLNVSGPDAPRRIEWAEVRSRDRTRTINGRPREFSSTFVRTYSLRQVR